MSDDASSLRSYLLGELDESEQEAIERELMVAGERFQELLIAEDELVDDYCAGKLSPSQEQRYRDRFLVTPERRLQHRFGAALRKRLVAAAAGEDADPFADRVPKRPLRPDWRLPLAAAVTALIAGGLWSLLRTDRPPLRLEQTAQEVGGPSAAFFLTRGSLRSLEAETAQTLTVPAGTALVELQLELPADAAGDHEVTLEDARRGAVLAQGTLPVGTIEGQSVVVATVPSGLLAPGDYRVILRAPSADGGLAQVGTYRFRVMSP